MIAERPDHERPRLRGWGLALGGIALLGAALLIARKSGSAAYSGSYKPSKRRIREGQPKEKGVVLERTVALMRPPQELYAFWRELENLPQFMSHLETVRQRDERRSHWVARTVGEAKLEWEAEITEDVPGRRIAWRSLPESQLPNEGSVDFEDRGERGTAVRVRMRFWPEAAMAATLSKLLGDLPEKMMAADLRRFQQLLEAGETATTEGQPVGEGQRSEDGKKKEGSIL